MHQSITVLIDRRVLPRVSSGMMEGELPTKISPSADKSISGFSLMTFPDVRRAWLPIETPRVQPYREIESS